MSNHISGKCNQQFFKILIQLIAHDEFEEHFQGKKFILLDKNFHRKTLFILMLIISIIQFIYFKEKKYVRISLYLKYLCISILILHII